MVIILLTTKNNKTEKFHIASQSKTHKFLHTTAPLRSWKNHCPFYVQAEVAGQQLFPYLWRSIKNVLLSKTGC